MAVNFRVIQKKKFYYFSPIIKEINMNRIKLVRNLGFILPVTFICSCTSEPFNETISSDGVKIAFDQKGVGDPAIVFVHGWTNQRIIWDDQMNHFSQKYKTISIDLAGSGESGNNRYDWTMKKFV